MTFEQPASLNRFIEPSIPHSWDFRWRLFKMFLPIIALFAIFFLQGILFKEWIHDNWTVSPFLEMLADFLILQIFLIFVVEVQLWALQKRKKVIKLQEKIIRIGSGLAQRIRWQRIVAWQLNNLTDEKNYRLVTIEYNGINRKILQHYSIALQKSQVDQLLSELKFRQKKDALAYSILDQETALPAKTFELRQAHRTSLYLYLVGALLFFEGLPLLLVGLDVKGDSPENDFVPNPNGSYASFVRAHFANANEYRHFLLITGGILCASGLALIIWSGILNKKAKAR